MLLTVKKADEGIARSGTEKFRKICDNILRQAKKIAADATAVATEEARAEKLQATWEVLSSRPVAWEGEVEIPGHLLPTAHALVNLYIANAMKAAAVQLDLTVKPHDTEERIDQAKEFLKRLKGELRLPLEDEEEKAPKKESAAAAVKAGFARSRGKKAPAKKKSKAKK